MPTFSHRSLFSNTFYNFLGKVLPLAVGVITIPILIHKMGTERFGTLNLVWAFIGYFGIFDLGLGRATTKFTADYLARNQREDLPQLIWTSLFLLFLLGLVASVLNRILLYISFGGLIPQCAGLDRAIYGRFKQSQPKSPGLCLEHFSIT